MVTNKNVCNIFLSPTFIETVFLTFVEMVTFLDTLSIKLILLITFIVLLFHTITESSTVLVKYLLFSQMHYLIFFTCTILVIFTFTLILIWFLIWISCCSIKLAFTIAWNMFSNVLTSFTLVLLSDCLSCTRNSMSNVLLSQTVGRCNRLGVVDL